MVEKCDVTPTTSVSGIWFSLLKLKRLKMTGQSQCQKLLQGQMFRLNQMQKL